MTGAKRSAIVSPIHPGTAGWLPRPGAVALGADGALVFGPGGREVLVRQVAKPVSVIDTSGAGDVFCGVFAASLAQGSPIAIAVGRAALRPGRHWRPGVGTSRLHVCCTGTKNRP